MNIYLNLFVGYASAILVVIFSIADLFYKHSDSLFLDYP